jgi:hypothetical protein
MKSLVLSLMLISFAQAAHASCGSFEVSKGDVKIQPASGAATAAAVGSKICAGDTVIAGDSARAKIQMEDGNELNISPNSKIVIETYQYDVASNKKKVMLNVIRGKVRATTKEENMYTDKAKDGQANTFQVRTKSAVAGVRGTDFLTSFDPGKNKMEVVTFRGKVEVGQLNGGRLTNSVFVAVGQRTVVIGGQTPSVPKAMPSGELMKQNTETHNETPPGSAANPPAAGPVAGGRDRDHDAGDSKRVPGANGPLAGEAPPAAGQGRAPGSTTGGGSSMISAGDLPSSNTATLPKLDLPPAPPQVPSAVLNNTVIINNAIQNRRSTVNLNLHVK